MDSTNFTAEENVIHKVKSFQNGTGFSIRNGSDLNIIINCIAEENMDNGKKVNSVMALRRGVAHTLFGNRMGVLERQAAVHNKQETWEWRWDISSTLTLTPPLTLVFLTKIGAW